MDDNTTIPSKMRAIRLHPPGGLDDISLDEVATPEAAEGAVLIRVHAAAITRDELEWPAARLPAVPSYELSGVVVASSAGDFFPGQDVYGLTDFDRDGVAAQYVAVPADELSPKPASLTHVEAAAVPLAGLSALQGLFDHGRLVKNERVLVHGGAGGVGGYAVQLAKLHGAYVIATTSTARVDVAFRMGADEVIDHTRADFTDLAPVDLVFDTGGGDRLLQSVKVLRSGGRLVSVAEDPPRDRCARYGIEGSSYLVKSDQDQLAELCALAESGDLQVLIDATYPLADARNAFEHIQHHGGLGKVVLTLDEAP